MAPCLFELFMIHHLAERGGENTCIKSVAPDRALRVERNTHTQVLVTRHRHGFRDEDRESDNDDDDEE